MNKRYALAIAATAAALTLGACSNGGGGDAVTTTETSATTSTSSATSSATTTTTAEAATMQGEGDIQLENGTVRAKTDPEKMMTGIFGVLHNTTDKDITVTGFTTSLGEADYELHETVDGVMREVEGGFVIPANGTFELKPGAEHMMIMDYAPEIPAGETVDITLETSDGDEIEIPGVAVRTMIPGFEDYGEDGQMMGHSMTQSTAGEAGHEGHEGH